nr:MAG TPA: ECF sigma factor [Caudoviricetes sp.]DAG15492.1 MAG TPA: ECF sigma factor [Caudoviricetes sp.]DAQ97353.1 MAG TPA: ECF sigma factor [Caudoviricetes sp.]
MLMKLYVFTKKDIDRFLAECNFTPDEERLFRLRCKEYTLEYCAEQMNVSISTAKRLSRRVNNKIIKVC